MFIAACLILVHIVCALTNMCLFGRVTGIFVVESFGGNCDYKQQGSIGTNASYNTCPLGIELNPFNYLRFQK
jgi:hypothetical protein